MLSPFLQLWTRFHDWTQILKNFNEIASQGKMKPPRWLAYPNETHVALLKWLAHYDDQRDVSKVMTNLLGAAVHLAILRSDALQQVLDMISWP